MKKALRYVLVLALAAAGCYLIAVAGMYWIMAQPPLKFAAIYAKTPALVKRAVPFRPVWDRARQGGLEIGDTAPDFELPTFDKSTKIKLSAFRGEKPVVLVFGSYT